jgi:hypothetical protein
MNAATLADIRFKSSPIGSPGALDDFVSGHEGRLRLDGGKQKRPLSRGEQAHAGVFRR